MQQPRPIAMNPPRRGGGSSREIVRAPVTQQALRSRLHNSSNRAIYTDRLIGGLHK